MKPFSMSRVPRLTFGPGCLSQLPGSPELAGRSRILLLHAPSFARQAAFPVFMAALSEDRQVQTATVTGEPSPETVDAWVDQFRAWQPELVVAIGGGSVLDAAKAISAMITVNEPVERFLEGVGDLTHPGTCVPMIAVPTTAGTGSEATRNAVLSRVGENGFKRSLRHEAFIPVAVWLDPSLLAGSPLHVAAAGGMDALTQLVESYLSVKANPVTDALVLPAVREAYWALVSLARTGETSLDIMSRLALPAFHSGVALANVGLGAVHGYASSVGGRIAAPHGVVCGTLLASVLEALTTECKAFPAEHAETLKRLAQLGHVTDPAPAGSAVDLLGGAQRFCDRVALLAEQLKLPKLSTYGLLPDMLPGIVAQTSNKECPVALSKEILHRILMAQCASDVQ